MIATGQVTVARLSGTEWLTWVSLFVLGCVVLAEIWALFRWTENVVPALARVGLLGIGEIGALLLIQNANRRIYAHLPNSAALVGWTLAALIMIALSLMYVVVYSNQNLTDWELVFHQGVTAIAVLLVLFALGVELMHRAARAVSTTAGNLVLAVAIIAVLLLVLLRRRAT